MIGLIQKVCKYSKLLFGYEDQDENQETLNNFIERLLNLEVGLDEIRENVENNEREIDKYQDDAQKNVEFLQKSFNEKFESSQMQILKNEELISNIENNIIENNDQLLHLKTESISCNENIKKLLKLCDINSEEIRNLRESLINNEQEIIELKSKALDDEEKNKRLTDACRNQMNDLNKSIKLCISEFERQLNIKDNDISELRDSIETMKSILKEDLQRFNNKNLQLENVIKERDNYLLELEKQLVEQNIELTELKTSISSIKTDLRLGKDQFNKGMENICSIEKRLVQCVVEAMNAIAVVDPKLTSCYVSYHNEKQSDSVNEVTILRDKLNDMEGMIVKVNSKMKKIEQVAQTKLVQISEFVEKIDQDMKNKINIYSERNKCNSKIELPIKIEYIEDLKQYKNTQSFLMNELLNFKGTITEQIINVTSEVSNLKSQYEILEENIVNKITCNVSNLEKDKEHVIKKIRDLEWRLGEIQEQHTFLRDELLSRNEEFGEDVGKRLEGLELEAIMARTNLNTFQDILAKLTQGLQTRINENIEIKSNLNENRAENDEKFGIVLNLIEPILESLNKAKDEVPEYGDELNEIASNWIKDVYSEDGDYGFETLQKSLTIPESLSSLRKCMNVSKNKKKTNKYKKINKPDIVKQTVKQPEMVTAEVEGAAFDGAAGEHACGEIPLSAELCAELRLQLPSDSPRAPRKHQMTQGQPRPNSSRSRVQRGASPVGASYIPPEDINFVKQNIENVREYKKQDKYNNKWQP